MSPCHKRVITNLNWTDSFHSLHPDDQIYSQYYDNAVHGQGATQIDRMYHYGGLKMIKAEYVPVPFSDNFSLVVDIWFLKISQDYSVQEPNLSSKLVLMLMQTNSSKKG